MKKRILALLLVAAMCFTVLVGCGNKETIGGDDSNPDTTPETSADSDSVAGEATSGASTTPETESKPSSPAVVPSEQPKDSVVEPSAEVIPETTPEPVPETTPDAGEPTPGVSTVPEADPKPSAPAAAPTQQPKPPAVEPFPVVTPTPTPTPEPTVAPSAPAVTGVEMDTFYDELCTSLYPVDDYGVGGPATVDLMDASIGLTAEESARILEMIYPGLKNIKAKQRHVYIPSVSLGMHFDIGLGFSDNTYEVVLMELTNAADVKAAKTILQDRIDDQVTRVHFYSQIQEIWATNARIVSNGNYVMMVVSSDCDAYVDAFNARF